MSRIDSVYPFIRVLIAASTSILLSYLVRDRDTTQCFINKREIIRRAVTFIAERTLLSKISGFIKLIWNCLRCNRLPEGSVASTIFADLEQVSRASVHGLGLSLYHGFFPD